MKKNWVKVCAIVIMAAFIITGILPVVMADDVDDKLSMYEQQRKELQDQINEAKKTVNNTVIEKNALLKELKDINDNIDDLQNTISQLDTEISEAQVQIDATQLEIDNKQRDLDGRLAIFNTRLKEIYQYGDVDFLEVLLQSSDLTDFLTRFEYLRYIADNDQKLLEEVKELKQSLEEVKTSLVALKDGLESKKITHESKVQELQVASSRQQELVNDKQNQLDLEYASLAAFEEASNQIASQIRSLQSSSGQAPSSMVWPCPSSHRITSKYGPRVHPIKKTKSVHTGVDIGASSGSSIVAAADGKVIAAGYNSAYGNYIIVDHGGGTSTLYGHMSAFVAHNGDQVTAGQQIGKVGSTGLSTGPHLHFEVRINGQHTSPNSYIGL